MKVLVIHNSYLEPGGEDGAVDSEIRMLKDFGNEVISYRCSNKDIKRFSFINKVKFLLKDISWNKKVYAEVKNLVSKEKPEIAHIHNIFILISPSVYYALKDAHIPIVQTLHNYRMICVKGTFFKEGRVCEECLFKGPMRAVSGRCWRGSLLLSFFLAKALNRHNKLDTFRKIPDIFIALSEFSRSKFIEAKFPNDKLFVKPNFTEIEVNTDKGGGYGLFIGRLADYKGVSTLLDAYERNSRLKLKIIGSGPMLKQVSKRAKDSKNIEFLGALAYPEAIGYLKKASFAVFPSECYENMPLVIIESFACGIPVIASNLGAMKELVQNNVTGLLFKPGDAGDLAEKAEFLTDNKEALESMRINSRKEYENKFTKQNNYDILSNIYKKAIAGYNQ